MSIDIMQLICHFHSQKDSTKMKTKHLFISTLLALSTVFAVATPASANDHNSSYVATYEGKKTIIGVAFNDARNEITTSNVADCRNNGCPDGVPQWLPSRTELIPVLGKATDVCRVDAAAAERPRSVICNVKENQLYWLKGYSLQGDKWKLGKTVIVTS